MSCCATKNCLAAEKFRAWMTAGAKRRLTLRPADFEDEEFSLYSLLLSGPLSERLAQRWRSFCSYMGHLTPFMWWKIFWYRRAGVFIGEHVYIAPGSVLDMLFPQLIRLEDRAVLGVNAVVMAHLYTPDRIVIARTTVGRRALVGSQAILGITSIGEEGVLAANSYTINPILDGQIGLGVPAAMRTRTSPRRGGHEHEQP